MPPSALTTAARATSGGFQSGIVEKALPPLPVATTKDASVPVPVRTRTAKAATTTNAASWSSRRVRIRRLLPDLSPPGPGLARAGLGPGRSAACLPGERGTGGQSLDGVGVDHLHGEPVGGARGVRPGGQRIGQPGRIVGREGGQGAGEEDPRAEAVVVG